jgi:hypothetical protein
VKLTTLYQWTRIFLIGFILSSTLGCAAIPAAPLVTRTPAPTLSLAPTGTLPPTPQPTLAPLQTASVNDPAAISLTGTCRSTIDGLAALTQGLKLPEHFTAKNDMRQPGDFDVNDYFKVFTHLKMAPGYALDYVYFGNGMGGSPILYARDINKPPFENYEAFLKSYGDAPSDQRSDNTLNHAEDYIKKIQPDGSPDSYFQFLALIRLGGQFYLSWHANYDDLKILCDASDLKTITQDLEEFQIPLPPEILGQAAKIDFQPVALVIGDTITLRYVAFTKWGGFYEVIYVLDKQSPTKPITVKGNLLIEYNCGIAF